MKLKQGALIAEIVASLSVVVTLVILITDVRENTATVRAAAAASSRDSLAGMNDRTLMLPDEKFDLMMRSDDLVSMLDHRTGRVSARDASLVAERPCHHYFCADYSRTSKLPSIRCRTSA